MTGFYWIYRKLISPAIHFLFQWTVGWGYSGCRFVPSCSHYSQQAVQKYGLLKGSYKTVVRVCQCHPYSKRSGWDPV